MLGEQRQERGAGGDDAVECKAQGAGKVNLVLESGDVGRQRDKVGDGDDVLAGLLLRVRSGTLLGLAALWLVLVLVLGLRL